VLVDKKYQINFSDRAYIGQDQIEVVEKSEEVGL
jgi:hypothetical protein